MRFLISMVFLGMLGFSSQAFAHEAPSGSQAKTEYIEKYVTLTETWAKSLDLMENGDFRAYVRASVKNSGPETIEELKVTVYFLDANGKPMGEHSFWPISEFKGKPLKPNYSYQADKGTAQEAEGIGLEWKGKTIWEITDIKFAK